MKQPKTICNLSDNGYILIEEENHITMIGYSRIISVAIQINVDGTTSLYVRREGDINSFAGKYTSEKGTVSMAREIIQRAERANRIR